LYQNITGLSVRFPAVVGCGATHGLLPDLVRKIQAEGDTIELWGDSPGALKPFINNRVLADIIYTVGLSDQWDRLSPITLSPKDTLSVFRVTSIVMEELGIYKAVEWCPSKVWIGDNKFVQPMPHFIDRNFPQYQMTSEKAIRLAMKEILAEQRLEK
jgi:hypothetical protein